MLNEKNIRNLMQLRDRCFELIRQRQAFDCNISMLQIKGVNCALCCVLGEGVTGRAREERLFAIVDLG